MNRSERRKQLKQARGATGPARFDRAFMDAASLDAEGRWDAALKAYRNLLAQRPDAASVLVRLGVLLGRCGDYLGAAPILERAVAAAPNDSIAHFNLGNVYAFQGRPLDAEAAYRRALDITPSLADGWLSLGGALKDSGQTAAAIEALEHALSLDNSQADAQFLLAMLRYREDHLEPAAEHLSAALKLNPGHPKARFFLGMIRDQQGEPNTAQFHFSKLGPDGAARLDSWRYVRAQSSPQTRLLATSFETLEFAFHQAPADGLIAEFGVRFANSLNFIAGLAGGARVHGLDSFEGIPDSWQNEAAGTYSTGGTLPPVEANVDLHVGLFSDTLPRFVAEHGAPLRFVNIDCDLYSSTCTVLDHLAAFVVPGTVLVFDEYLMHDTWREDEHRAFQEAVAKQGWNAEYLAFSLFTKQAVIRIT